VFPGFLALVAFVLSGSAIGFQGTQSSSETVGFSDPQRVVLPVSQILSPAGTQVELPGMRPQVLAMSPDGKLLATSGKTNQLVILDPDSGSVIQRVPFPAEQQVAEPVSDHILEPDEEGQVSYTGLRFSPDGRRIYLSNVEGSVKVFGVDSDRRVQALYSIPLPETGLHRRAREIPSGLAFSEDGSRLFVVLNLTNQLAELDIASGRIVRTFDVGVAPYSLLLVEKKAYVSNWGGRRPGEDDLVGPAGRGTVVRVDPVRHIASEGSVSVINLTTGSVEKEILTGMHASEMALSPDGRHLLVANAASDNVSVIEIASNSVIETISLKWQPDDYYGANPNALAFDASGKKLYVCNGSQNAVAVVSFDPGKSQLLGLIPVGWFPGAILYDNARSRLYVANIKGMGSGRRTFWEGELGFNSRQYFGTISLVDEPDEEELTRYTRTVLANCRREMLERSLLPARPDQPPRPVPERVGEPSVFEHVVYIIKENRTYDQVLGDLEQGRGDPDLCIFGEKVTPNQHKMVRDFVLLDNTYCSGILSADGHQWSTTAITTDYMEKSFAGFPRSYPDGMEDDDVDALAYAPSGFIWDNAIERGKTLRVFGEFAIGAYGWMDLDRTPAPTFLDYYRDFINQTGLTAIGSRPAIESLRPYLEMDTIGWAMEVPDIFRAAQFIKKLKQYEESGEFPNLVIICLPNDHASGTKEGYPTPAAHVADNDLAFGQIVEAISHSPFWKKTAIFAIEDDPQDGWDHISSYRTTAYVISPYTKRGEVISTQYNQPGMLRTIELILGLPPMNQMDAVATPMTDCFTDQPDFTPFKAVPNNIPLDQMNPPKESIKDPLLRHYAELSETLPLDKVDQCPEDLLNRILWHAQKGSQAPFPEWAVSDSPPGVRRP
ncbi:MAG: bifunctional YncE family protein/alkaline phosphatase family protein, partial [Acidobacteriota bacterium]